MYAEDNDATTVSKEERRRLGIRGSVVITDYRSNQSPGPRGVENNNKACTHREHEWSSRSMSLFPGDLTVFSSSLTRRLHLYIHFVIFLDCYVQSS